MKVALVYDRINKWGGAERVLLALKEIFPKALLYTSVHSGKNAAWADIFKKQGIYTSFLQKIPKASTSHELFAFFMPLAFENLDFDDFDLVISLTSEAAKGIITKPKTIHICYCLTPTRYLWSGYEDYFKSPFLKLISYPMVSYLRKWDKLAAKRPDAYIAISKEVQNRIKKYYGIDSVVVYPPVDQTIFNQKSKSKFSNANSNYFLIVSRLVPYKRVDLAVKVFNKLKLPLKIIGVGSEYKRLCSMAKSNIDFLGNLTDNDLLRYYKGCVALVFPGNEDFGLTIIEAQIFGKPVIAYKKGGALETVIEGKTGLFFYPQEESALEDAVKKLLKLKLKDRDCFENALKFNKEQFKKQFIKEINNIINKNI